LKFRLISTIDDLPVSLMCKFAGVSKSGYYKWLKNINNVKDEKDALLIAEIFFKNRKKLGYRGIKMVLLNEHGIVMNHKKILRIMKKYNLQTKVRRSNPYKKAARIIQENINCNNVLNREFRNKKPNEAYTTDITYLKYSGNTAFLSVLLDVKTSEVVSYKLSKTLQMDFVLETIKCGLKNTPIEKLGKLLIHSDRGAHYTSFEYRTALETNGVIQSISDVASPLDNAPVESFFGHFKDEAEYKKCETFEELADIIDEYMYYYNNRRYQWTKNKMTPIEYKKFLLAS